MCCIDIYIYIIEQWIIYRGQPAATLRMPGYRQAVCVMGNSLFYVQRRNAKIYIDRHMPNSDIYAYSHSQSCITIYYMCVEYAIYYYRSYIVPNI